jgi:MFS family permease
VTSSRGVGGFKRQFAESASAFAAVIRNVNLRRLELGWGASVMCFNAYSVALSVYAFEAGGAAAVGLIFLLRMIPAAVVSPFAGLLADRYPRERVLVVSVMARTVLYAGATVAVFAHTNEWVVYGLAIAGTLVQTPIRSAMGALTPALCSSPAELTAANAASSSIESLATFIGPAIAGLLLAVTSLGVVFTVCTALMATCAFLMARVRAPEGAAPKAELEASTIVSESLAGFRAIGREPSLRVLVTLFTAQTFVAGAVGVFIVVLSIQVLGLGNAGVGYIDSAFGIGALMGGAVAFGLTGARRLSPSFLVGVVLWGAPLALITASYTTAVVLLLVGVMGIGNTLIDVAGFTLIQRAVPDNVLARVFGVIATLWSLSIGVGAWIAPKLISWLGLSHALLLNGLGTVALAIALAQRVVGIDAHAHAPDVDELRLIGRVPIFSPLAGATLEHLVSRLVPVVVEPGTEVVKEGDPGDRFYVIAEGELDVSADGQPLSSLGAGDYFGEIALLRDVPRTASVTARTRSVLYALDREDFLAAVTGYAASSEAAERVVSARLAAVPSAGVGAGT